MPLSTAVARLNTVVAQSFVGTWFRLAGSSHPLARPGAVFTTELRAGAVTFAAMAYIISVNASILSNTGATCQCPGNADDPVCDNDPEYAQCVNVLRRDLITATSAISALSSGLMGLLANMPLGLAPGLGTNAYFAFTVVGYHGTGLIPYSQALGAVFLEGIIFMILSLCGLRQWIARLLPHSLKLATGAGIGLYLAFIGLGPSGLSVIGGNTSDLVGLGGCKPEYQDENGFCQSHVLQDPRVWLGVFLGGILTAVLLLYRVRGAFIIGILLVSIASWPRNSAVTSFPHTPTGDDNFDFFKKVATFHPFKIISAGNIDFNYGNGKVWLALITLLYVDLLDLTGTLYAMSRQAGLMDDRTGDFEGSSVAYIVDSFCVSMGSLMGLSPCTAFIESGAGIAEGGRTGITALVVSFGFFISLFFAPIFASIPSNATGSVLVIVGSMMARNAAEINWEYAGDAIPAFLTVIMIPLSYNIAYGLIAGICSYICINGGPYLLHRISARRVPLPPGWDVEKEPWNLRLVAAGTSSPDSDTDSDNGPASTAAAARRTGLSTILPPWLFKLLSGNKTFWRMTDSEINAYLEGRRETAAAAERRARQRERERAAMFGGAGAGAKDQEGGNEDGKAYVDDLESGQGASGSASAAGLPDEKATMRRKEDAHAHALAEQAQKDVEAIRRAEQPVRQDS